MNSIKETIYDKIKGSICDTVYRMEKGNKTFIAELRDRVLLTDYAHLARKSEYGTVWTEALQTALREHEIVEIPTGKAPYYIDSPVIIPSNRRIEAWRAVIKLAPGCRTLMLRNEHTADGTYAPVDGADRDRNISIHGGCFAESQTDRRGYGESGRYSENGEGFYGVSTCMLFNNIEGLTLTDVTFRNTAGFSVQIGDVKNAVFDNIWFDACFADGLHINGNSENVLARNIYGEVGDDLVALNAYDWANSSVNFGTIYNVLCENLNLAPMSRYKALRMEAGVYEYADGRRRDCSLFNVVIKNVMGIRNFKLYYQSEPYDIGKAPEGCPTGSVDNVFFDGIRIDLCSPVDGFREYVEGDGVRGAFGAFELGADIGSICFENIDFTHYAEEFPHSYLITIGPKSIVRGGREIFDPYIDSTACDVRLKNIRVNGKKPRDIRPLLHETVFDDVNGDGRSSGSGCFESITQE